MKVKQSKKIIFKYSSDCKREHVFELFSATFSCICFSRFQLHRLSYQTHIRASKQTKTQSPQYKAPYRYQNLEKETLQSGVILKVANTKVIALTKYSLNPTKYQQDATTVKRINLEIGLGDTDRSSYSFSRHCFKNISDFFSLMLFVVVVVLKPNDSESTLTQK